MGVFPGAIPAGGSAVPTATLVAAGHTALHNTDADEIRALATKLGTGASTPAAGKYLKGTGVGTSAWSDMNIETDTIGTMPISRGGTGVDTDAELKALVNSYVYPVGSIYTNATDSTNPSTILGFGTWVAFGAGRVLVGDGTSDAVYVAGATGGESTHVLTLAESPAHTHALVDPGFTPGVANRDDVAGGIGRYGRFGGGINTDSKGGGGAHNNLQPYIVIYMWKRTA